MKRGKSREHGDRLFADFFRSGGMVILVFLSSILTLHADAESRAKIASEEPAYGEYHVKAAYLYNFPKFISWPKGSFSAVSTGFNLCVLGESHFGDAFQALQSKTIDGKQVSIIYEGEARKALGCHLLFVSSSESGSVDEILSVFDGYAIVTVSDINGFAAAGGIIELAIRQGRIIFKINQGAALRQHLDISSSLLDLAKVVFRNDE